MRNFILGIIAICFSSPGRSGHCNARFLPTNADSSPPKMEDASRCPRGRFHGASRPACDQSRATDGRELIDGMKIYTMKLPPDVTATSTTNERLRAILLSPAPQLVLNPMDVPSGEFSTAVRTGIRYTGMPAWNKF